MTRKASTKRRPVRTPDRPPARPSRVPALGLAAAVIVLVAAGWQLWVRKTVPASAPTAALAPHAGFAAVRGRWQRADGGYVLEIKDVAPSGRMDVSYFNPRPIRVARADASVAGSAVHVFVELRDVNYPGSTYQLTYDPDHDRLEGTYFQAALEQTFDVTFSRLR